MGAGAHPDAYRATPVKSDVEYFDSAINTPRGAPPSGVIRTRAQSCDEQSGLKPRVTVLQDPPIINAMAGAEFAKATGTKQLDCK